MKRCNVIGNITSTTILSKKYDEIFVYNNINEINNIENILYTFLVKGEDLIFVPPLNYKETKLLLTMIYEVSFPDVKGKVYILSPTNELEEVSYEKN